MKKFVIWATLFFTAALSAQNPQTSTAPIYGANSKYVQGTGPGYWPTAGSGLTLNVGPGTPAYSCSTMPYTGGTLSMTASTTNYVYLNTAASCVPAVKTTAFTSSDIPLAIVVTSGSAITSITDYRAALPVPSSGGSSVSINSSSASAPNFNNSTPAAGTNGLNVQFQKSGNNVSAQVVGDGTATHFLNGQGGYTTPAGSGGATNVSCPSGSSSNAQCFSGIPNDTSAGTVLNMMACWNGQTYEQENLTNCAAGTYGTDSPISAVGVCVAGCGASGTATIQFDGAVSWYMDTTVYAGQQIQMSTSVAGEGTCPNGVLPGCIAPGEHTYQTMVFGRVITGNTGSGTLAIVQLSPFTTSAIGAYSGSYPDGSFAMLSAGNGSSFLQQSQWQQAPSNSSFPFAWTGFGIAFPNHTGTNNPCSAIYNEGDGVSGNDVSFDTQTNGPDNCMFEWKGSNYFTPDVKTVNGTVTQPHGGAFYPGASSNLHIWTLSGNSTMWTPSNDNPGDIIYFDLIQAASGGPFTWTWPTGPPNFVNMPAISTVAGSETITAALFDGTNYYCVVGCPPVLPAPAIVQIGQVVVASPVSTITFGSIPSGYASLKLVISGQTSGSDSDNINMNFNGDTGAHYSVGFSQGGVSTNHGSNGAQTSGVAGCIAGGSGPTSWGSTSEVVIAGYAQSDFYIMALSTWGCFSSGANALFTGEHTSQWQPATLAPITSLVLTDAGGSNFLAGTTATLYGMQ